MSKININQELCKKDGICVQICPAAIFVQTEKATIPELIHEELCISCGHCVAVCPQGAISHIDFSPGSIKPINHDLIPSIEQITELLKARRSIREFKDKPVEKELIEKIIDGARFAPSAHNTQSTEFVVVQDKDLLNKITELTTHFLNKIIKQFSNPMSRKFFLLVARDETEGAIDLLPFIKVFVKHIEEGKDMILHNAPVLLIFHARRNVIFSSVNTNLALQNASLIAEGLGLGSFYVGFITAACERDNSIQKLLSIPSTHQIYAVMALGYPKFEYNNWIERRPPKIEWK